MFFSSTLLRYISTSCLGQSCQPNDQMWQFQCSLLSNNFGLNIIICLAYVTLLSGIASAKPIELRREIL